MGERKPDRGADLPGTDLMVEEKVRVQPPNRYRVVMLNDDYTPMDFVIFVLQSVFHKPYGESVRLMLDVHKKGKGHCGVFPYDIARTKVYQVHALAEEHGHPLQCLIEATEDES